MPQYNFSERSSMRLRVDKAFRVLTACFGGPRRHCAAAVAAGGAGKGGVGCCAQSARQARVRPARHGRYGASGREVSSKRERGAGKKAYSAERLLQWSCMHCNLTFGARVLCLFRERVRALPGRGAGSLRITRPDSTSLSVRSTFGVFANPPSLGRWTEKHSFSA